MRQSQFAAALMAFTVGLGGFPLAAAAQTYVPPDRGVPGRREGGGTRGGCAAAGLPLTALMPVTNFGQTTEAYPTWYWYVPAVNAEAAEFVLLDRNDVEVYQVTFQIADRSGIVSLRLPETSGLPPLTVGEDYRWYFLLICDLQDRSADLYTEGVIQRIQPSAALAAQLSAAAAIDRATLYAEAGIWHDALALLGELRRQPSQNPEATQRWQALLESIDLGQVAAEPMLP